MMSEAREASDLALRGVVHDLNNVFQTILDAARLLEPDEKWSAVGRMLQRTAQRGQRIVASMDESDVATVDLETIVEDAIEFAGDALRAMGLHGIGFERDVERGLHLRGVPIAWERVLLNLFLNAGQAMKQGGVVRIIGRRDGDNIEIVVTDEGPGIPEENLAQVFRPNFSTKQHGSGLGLHIVELIVRQNGGAVRVANRPDAPGAAFHIKVPA